MSRPKSNTDSKPTDQVAIWLPKAKVDEILKLKNTEKFKYVEEENPNSLAKYMVIEILIDYAEKNGVDVNPVVLRTAKMKARKK